MDYGSLQLREGESGLLHCKSSIHEPKNGVVGIGAADQNVARNKQRCILESHGVGVRVHGDGDSINSGRALCDGYC